MKKLLLILLISLSSFVHAADAIEVQAEDTKQNLWAAVKAESLCFRHDVTIHLINEEALPIEGENLSQIHKDIMAMPGLFKDPRNGCKTRANDIKFFLDEKKVWNLLVYIGVTGRYSKAGSPFLLGGARNWNHHWANLVAIRDDQGGISPMVIDPLLFPQGPQRLCLWFNELAADGNMFDAIFCCRAKIESYPERAIEVIDHTLFRGKPQPFSTWIQELIEKNNLYNEFLKRLKPAKQNEDLTVKVNDPLLFPDGPQRLGAWLDAFVAGDNLPKDIAARPSKLEGPLKPTSSNLFLVLDDHF